MKAISAARLDSLADYAEVELPTPEPGAGQLRIRVAAVGIGYVDALVALGRYQVKPPLPHIPGSEVAGVVDAIGDGVSGWSIGDRVVAMTVHGFAQQVLAPAATSRHLPVNASFEAGAAFPLNYLTALHGLADRGQLTSGETMLVFGAAGGVGSAAIDVGKAHGAHVIAAASTPEKHAFALARGADAVIDTDVDGWRDRLKALLAGRKLDMVFDPLCGPLFESAFRSLGWGGRHLVVGFVGGPIPALPSNLTLMKGAALIGVDVRQFQLFEKAAAARHLDTLTAWLGGGRVAPAVGKIFDWADFGPALEAGLAGKTPGKIILSVRD
ncbi:NADPH:quinone oxidoreductase [Polymorphobacter glacialis]|uniref:NADPH:quinone oxidoreductase n=1 Tax=Sandarakinorhabdus glacialis TaxID=1614636 RepID=A0A916ZM86_9SPHN|nr:NADPH:quinone oxidoreductase family protein [Polymorphobacter glacialis]GGE04678.1 NADPH:quinone oxidoreductase [Polymorphobacter glacialis]